MLLIWECGSVDRLLAYPKALSSIPNIKTKEPWGLGVVVHAFTSSIQEVET